MKAEINVITPKTEYPCLKMNKGAGLVVLFGASRRGTVVVSNRTYPLGEFREDWIEENFEVLPSTTQIILAN